MEVEEIITVQVNPANKSQFCGISAERGFADFIFAHIVLHLIVINFIGSTEATILALFLAPVAALVAQGEAAIELLRRTYLRRGWRGGYY